MRKRITSFAIIFMMAFMSVVAFNMGSVRADAAESSFSGTVSSKTTTERLFLDTSSGTMEFKIDSNLTVSGSKMVLPGSSITATGYVGSDAYWHVTKISGTTSSNKVTVDQSTKATVKGRIANGTSEELLYLVVDNGTMQIKIDDDTDLSGTTMLIVGKTVQVECARGSDAYMHALSISDAYASTGYSSTTSSSYSASTVAAVSGTAVTGTVEKGTTSSKLYLSTSAGTMEFVLDLTTDVTGCRVLIPGQSITVNFYRGSDAWNHTSKIVNNSASAASQATLDSSSKVTVTGTVEGETTENTLFLSTSAGTMQIRLDSATDFSRCPVILKDKSLQVVIERGNDEYYHAISIAQN